MILELRKLTDGVGVMIVQAYDKKDLLLKHSIDMTNMSILLIYIPFKRKCRYELFYPCTDRTAQVAALFLEKYIEGRNKIHSFIRSDGYFIACTGLCIDIYLYIHSKLNCKNNTFSAK